MITADDTNALQVVIQVYADATLVFPLLVAETFARRHGDFKQMHNKSEAHEQ